MKPIVPSGQVEMVNPNFLFFTLRTARTSRQVPLTTTQIKKVLVEPRRIVVHCIDGCTHVNSNPTPKERAYWSKYGPPKKTSVRWDMPTPDPMAMALLDDYVEKKQLK